MLILNSHSHILSGSPKNGCPGSPVRELLRSGFLPTDPSIPCWCALAPAGPPLQLRLHPGGEWRSGQPGNKPTGGRQQPGQAQSGSSQPSWRLHPDTTHTRREQSRFRDQRHRRNTSWEPHHPQELSSHADTVHLKEAGNRNSCWGMS